MSEVPDFLPHFPDDGPSLRALALLLLDDLGASCTVTVWNDVNRDVRYTHYFGRAAVNPDGFRQVQVVVAVPGQGAYIVRIGTGEATATDVDRTVVGLLEQAASEKRPRRQ